MTTIRRPRPRPARDNAPQVVVAGAGFGGLAAVRALACAGMQVTLIDCNIYATFQPLLYQVATAGLADSDIAYPLRTITRRYGAVFRHGELAGIDPATRQVTLADRTTLGYDHLIVATGLPPPTTGIPGAAEHALGLYTRRDAIALRDRITAELDQISRTGDRSDVTVTVIGGGATGVELAGTLADLRDTILAALFPEIDPARIHITLLHRGPDLLAPFHPAYGSTPAASSPDATSRSGSAPHRPDRPRHGHPRRRHRPAQRHQGVGGRRGRPGGGPRLGLPQTAGGRIRTGPDLRVAGQDRIFAVGDIAVTDGQPLPQLAQPAHRWAGTLPARSGGWKPGSRRSRSTTATRASWPPSGIALRSCSFPAGCAPAAPPPGWPGSRCT